MKTSETKKFVKIFCEAFLILRKYFHFYKKGFLNSQAGRIRVKTNCLNIFLISCVHLFTAEIYSTRPNGEK
jgi:hypothetical protein